MAPCTGFPLNFRTPPLLGASRHTTLYTTHVPRSSLSLSSQGSTARPPGAPALPDSLFYSPAERRVTAAVAVSDVSSSEAVPPSHLRRLAPLARLRGLFLLPPPPAIPGPNPRARAAALDRRAAPPREVGPALFGRGFAPAPAVSLSSSARPYAPTPLSKAASAHLSPPPTTDPKPSLGPSGLGFPVRRWVRYHTAVTPFPHLLLPGTPASGGAAPDPPGHSERVHTAAAPPAAGVEAAVGAVGTVAALAAQTPGAEPLGRPHDPAAVPVAGVEMAVWVAETMAALAAAPPGVEPQGRPSDPAVAPAAGAEVVVAGAGLVAVPAAATPGAGPRGMPPASAAIPAVAPRVGRPPRS